MTDNQKREFFNTPSEDIVSSVIQALAAALAIGGLVALIYLALPYGALSITGVSVYGGTLIFAFLASALYHGVRHDRIKRVFRTIDHCAILLLIAGTYTPVALIVLEHHGGMVLLSAVWSIALTGVAMRIATPRLFLKLRVAFYLVMGWLVVGWASPVIDGIGAWGAGLFLAGGLTYSAGLVFYAWKRLPYNHAVWHLFVIAGSSCFYIATTLFVIPGHA